MAVPKILVCDDSKPERAHMTRIAISAGCIVIIARNGREALELAKKERPELIFMDVIMPEMDGYESCRRLRGDPETCDIPVIFVTSKNQKSDRFYARMQGGKDLIGKPVRDNDLLEMISQSGPAPETAKSC